MYVSRFLSDFDLKEFKNLKANKVHKSLNFIFRVLLDSSDLLICNKYNVRSRLFGKNFDIQNISKTHENVCKNKLLSNIFSRFR